MTKDIAKVDNPLCSEKNLDLLYEKKLLVPTPMPGMILIMPLNVRPKGETNSGIILPGDSKVENEDDMKYKFDVHPNQAEVFYVGPNYIKPDGTEDVIPVKKGDLVYLLHPPHPSSFVVINGLILCKISRADILCKVEKFEMDAKKS